MNEPNAVFELMRPWRAAAYRAQKWLLLAGALWLAVSATLAALGLLSAWALTPAPALLAAGAAWGLAWRRRVERRFWAGGRIPRRGRKRQGNLTTEDTEDTEEQQQEPPCCCNNNKLSSVPSVSSVVKKNQHAGLLLLAAALLCGPAAAAAESTVAIRLGEGRALDAATLLAAAGPGGLAALGIGALSLLLALYLLLSLWSARFAPRKLRDELLQKLAIGDAAGARILCETDDSVLARATLAGLAGGLGEPAAKGRALPGALMLAEAARRLRRWRTLIDLLAAAGVIGPLAGMFGALLELIRAFAAVSGPELSPAIAAAGTVGALVPAAAGVGAALAALGAYYLADLRLAALAAAAETACAEVGAALADAAEARPA